jgi:iron complex outermembrane receptor protein
MTAGMDAEYVYSRQLSGEKKGFTLPFSPPASSVFSIRYAPEVKGPVRTPSLLVEYRVIAGLYEIVPPEKKTPGYQVMNVTFSGNFFIGAQNCRFQIKAVNLFNTRYLDHTSFYRLIEVPGPGRSFSLSLHIPIGSAL